MINDLIQISQKLLLSIKVNEPDELLMKELSDYSLDKFSKLLPDDNSKKAFWINIYNAYFIYLRKHLKIEGKRIFRQGKIVIAGNLFCLDEIEHGILRRFKYKYSLGYFNSLFIRNAIKQLAVDKPDFRIHFALNCGANSCPPISSYSENIDEELHLATRSFLQAETVVSPSEKTIHISKLFKWYYADFGGRKGIRRILRNYLELNPSDYSIRFNAYDWNENLNNFNF